MRKRFFAATCFVTCAFASAALVEACVGDEPSDASSGGDASSGQDGATSDGSTSSDASSQDSSISDAGLSFDGANAYCNDLFPGDVPQIATVECPDAAVGFAPVGGTILTGHYYLVDETENAPACDTGGVGAREGVHDRVEISLNDAGDYVVNAALDGTNARRITLEFSNFGADTFTLTTTCPADAGAVSNIQYSSSNDVSYQALQYQIPVLGTQGIYTFHSF